MKNIIIGTAGHIDHGKTTLIQALTGRNTDRWEEEKRRGITIDLGFTYFDLSNGNRVGIIDVPGHERFVSNMTAGVVGMDLVLLVVAADEGMMPQTREHVDILGQLGVEKSILVLNKCDLVEDDWLELVEEEIKEEVKGTFLEGAPLVKVSALTRKGIPELIEVIEKMTMEDVSGRDIHTIPRLPIDRVFTITGFGTVVTGTLLAGTVSKEDVLQMYPLGKTCKIRGLQVHGQEVDKCFSGQRVAINLSNVKKSEIRRGCVLAPVNSMKNTTLLDVKLNVVPSSTRVLKNNIRLHLFTGTSEILCRAFLLEQEEIGPGESGYAQLRLEEEIALCRGDKFVVRFYSPLETIGGGVVLEANPKKKKRFDQSVIKDLQRKESGSPAELMELQIQSCGESMVALTELAKIAACSVEEAVENIKSLEEQGLVKVFRMKKDTYVWHATAEQNMRRRLIKTIRAYHERYPYRYGIKKAEIHMKYMKKMKVNLFDTYIEMLSNEGVLKREQEILRLHEFELRRDSVYETVCQVMQNIFQSAQFDFVRFSEVSFGNLEQSVVEDILLLLLDEGVVVKIAEDIYTLRPIMEYAEEVIQKQWQEIPLVTIAQVRDVLGTSRKNAKLVLEYMERTNA